MECTEKARKSRVLNFHKVQAVFRIRNFRLNIDPDPNPDPILFVGKFCSPGSGSETLISGQNFV
jgi:hypothetical protein